MFLISHITNNNIEYVKFEDINFCFSILSSDLNNINNIRNDIINFISDIDSNDKLVSFFFIHFINGQIKFTHHLEINDVSIEYSNIALNIRIKYCIMEYEMIEQLKNI